MREKAQFWVAIISTAALAGMAIGCAVADANHGNTSSNVTMLAVGALSTLSGACVLWLFPRDNGGGNGPRAGST